MFQKIKSSVINIHNACIPSFIANDKRKRIIFLAAFYILLATTFFTIFGQIPFFSSRGLTKIFQVGWVLAIIPLLMLDYKNIIKSLLKVFILFIPFLLYCLTALLFKINPFNYDLTTIFLISLYILFIGLSFGKYKTIANLKVVIFCYVIGATLYATIVYIFVLRGYDLENQIYAFADKNSAGPIYLSAAILSFYVFDKKRAFSIVARWGMFIFFSLIIALSKNRAMLVLIPIVAILLFAFETKKKILIISAIIATILFLAILFGVPFLREKVVINILFNGKTNIDDIFSGRITQIITCVKEIKLILGGGNAHVDCMPVYILCAYGIIGTVALIPVAIHPLLFIFRYKKKGPNKHLGEIILVLYIMFILSSLFEGFGYFGPGAKIFILWMSLGILSFGLEANKKSYSFIFFDKVFTKIANKINPNHIITTVQFSLLFFALIAISLNSTAIKVGETFVDKLPYSNQIEEYIKIQDNTIDSPINSMCVGQKITFKTKTTPDNAYDRLVYWSTGWISNPSITVNGYTGEVTALKKGGALLHINRFRVGPNGVYIQFPIQNYEEYNFNKLYISSTPFSSSFSNTLNETLNMKNNCTMKIFYDNFYLPKDDDFVFVSSNENVVTVDKNGIVRAHKPGTSTIKGVINNTYNNESLNTLTINVIDDSFIPVSYFDIDYSKQCYQYEPYDITPSFNIDASDKNFEIQVSGLKYTFSSNYLVFNEFGKAQVTISSQNNSIFTKTFNINVIENPPVKFTCETNRIKIGEKKNATELGLYLEFQNGYKKIINDDDIYFNPFDFSNRAWSNQNGLIENRTTIYAVKKGTIRLDYTSKIDYNVKATFYITCSVYTAAEYAYLCNGVGTTALSFVLLIALFFSLFVDIKRKWILYISLSATNIAYITISFLLYGISLFTIIPAIINAIALFTVILLRIIKKDRFPLKFLEDPAEYSPPPQSNIFKEDISI